MNESITGPKSFECCSHCTTKSAHSFSWARPQLSNPPAARDKSGNLEETPSEFRGRG
jgi:hypothetical protein